MNSKILISLILTYFLSLSRAQPGFLSPTQENAETIVFTENFETILEEQQPSDLQSETILAKSIAETLQADTVEPEDLQEFNTLPGEVVNMDAAFDTISQPDDESDEELLDSEFLFEENEEESLDCGTEDETTPGEGSCITKIHCTMVFVQRIGWTPIYKTEVVCG